MYIYVIIINTMTQFNSTPEANKMMELAFGRILKMGSRPSQDGDIEMYEKCKWLIMDAAEYLGMQTTLTDTASYQANYNKIHHD